jgi:hypothetical protein
VSAKYKALFGDDDAVQHKEKDKFASLFDDDD